MTTEQMFYSEEALKYLNHLEKDIHKQITSEAVHVLEKRGDNVISINDIKKIKKTVLQKLANNKD